jgi:hypothetical protein
VPIGDVKASIAHPAEALHFGVPRSRGGQGFLYTSKAVWMEGARQSRSHCPPRISISGFHFVSVSAGVRYGRRRGVTGCRSARISTRKGFLNGTEKGSRRSELGRIVNCSSGKSWENRDAHPVTRGRGGEHTLRDRTDGTKNLMPHNSVCKYSPMHGDWP